MPSPAEPEVESFSPPSFPDVFNLADYFLDQRVAEGRGNHTAIIDDAGRYTYQEVQTASQAIAGALWEHGVRLEDRVLIALPDCVEFAESFFGILKAGAVVSMVNPELPEADYHHYLHYTRCRALVIDAALCARVAPMLAECDCLRLVIVVGGPTIPEPPGVRVISWETALLAPPRATYPTSKDDPAIWLFTSGSTGQPKAAVHFHHDFAFNTECYAKRVLGITKTDITISVPKLYFGYATGTNLMFPFAVGATTVLFRDRPAPPLLFTLIGRHRVTLLVSVPTSLNRMIEADPQANQDLSSLRMITSAGEALPEELYRRFKTAYGVEIIDGIGSAELFHVYISNRLGEVRPGSLGRLVPGYEARIVREDGSDAETGEIGTLHVRGDSAALCYWQAHEQSKKTLRGDWVVSGDLFHRDERGYFYYDGRADDLLKVGGIYVSPLEVEGVLCEHVAVLEAAVIGEENEVGLMRPLAYVVVRAGHAATAELSTLLIGHVRSRLVHYKAPDRIEFVEALPRSDRGKILRRKLRGTAAK